MVAIMTTLFLTRPAASVISMTPVSGLMTLQSMAAKSVPYEQAIASHQPTFIEFYADWCTTCQGMSATVDRLHHDYGHQVNFVMLNIDDPQWAEPIAQFHASGVPQFTLLNAEQQSVNTWVGKVPTPIFTAAFAELIGAAPSPAFHPVSPQ